ncbi:MAG: hypothetical protein ACRD0D_06305 [Acidimicrobiales bacterium]
MGPVDIAADLTDEDETGLVWARLAEARDPHAIVPGAILIAGEPHASAVAQVVDVVPRSFGAVVHLRILPGTLPDYLALARRTRPWAEPVAPA